MTDPAILTVTTAAETYDLTTLETAKDELGITTNDGDARLKRWIHETSGFIQTYCNRVFASETVSEKWRFTGQTLVTDPHRARLRLARRPVTSITSIVEDDGTALTSDSYELDAARGWLYRISGQTSGVGGARTPWSASKVVVTYTGGYALLTDLPWQLETACLALLKHRHAARGRDPMLRQQTLPGELEQVWWVPGAGQSSLPPEVAELLDPLREVNV